MEAVDQIKAEIRHLFLAKASRRRALAQLSFPEKVAAVIRLQEMAAPILRARGRDVQPWQTTRPSASKASPTKS